MKPRLTRVALRALASFAALAIPGSCPAFGQSPAGGQVFRATTKLVQVSVVARDQSGKPVPDLKREEFQIFDNGAPQKIRVFVSEKSAPDSAAPRSTGAFSNRLAGSKGSHSGYSVILIDGLLATFLDPGPPMEVREHGSGLARLQALKVLRSLPEGEKIAIYATGRVFNVICEFTSDRNLLERELEKWKPNVDTPDTSVQVIQEAIRFGGGVRGMETAARQVDDAMRKQLNQAGTLDIAGRVDSSDGQMEAVADHLTGIPGRKNLLWLSNRFALGPRAIQKFNRASVSLYPIDTDGICEHCAARPIGTMNAIAAATGGLAFYRRNDLDVAMREAIEDGMVSYLLGFYVPEEEREALHQLSVQVNRPGVTLRYLSSYRSAARGSGASDARSQMVQAMNQTVDATGIALAATGKRSGKKLDLTLAVDLPDLDLELERGLWQGKTEVAVRFLSAEGSPVGDTVAQTVTFSLRPATYASMAGSGLPLQRDFTIPEQAAAVKVLIGNLASGKIGTLTIPLAEVKTK